jgi:UDP:flavonoid glycosyltransferase YjiC (YdhE family)
VRVLMALWGVGGHVPVEIGVARRLVDAGHQVTVIGEPTMQPAVTTVGSRFTPWVTAPTAVEDDIADWECRTPLTLFPRLLNRLITGPSARYATDVRAIAQHDSYDAAVVDVALMGAQAGTESLGIPTAVTIPNTYIRPTPGRPSFGLGHTPATGALTRLRDQALPRLLDRLWDMGLRDLNTTRRDLDLDPLGHVFDQLDRAARVLVLTAESFDFPTPGLPPNVRYVGPILDDPTWADQPLDLPPGDEPLVLVSLSSGRIRGGDQLLARVMQALDDAPIRAVVTTGPALPTIRASRPGIHVVPAGSHRHLLPHAAAVITHGGHGTVIKTLAAGKPLLVLPLGRDQPDNAARVASHGAGIHLRSTASPRQISNALAQLVNQPTYRIAAETISARMRADTGDRRITSELEAIAE